jgi:hypothetical protein
VRSILSIPVQDEILVARRQTWLGGFIIAVTAMVTYLPALKIQFYDGWWYLIWSATMDLPRFLIQFLDPSNITQGYRPVQGIYMYLLYHLFEFNSDGYHLAHNLLHAANAVLVYLIVLRLGKRLRLAFVAGLVYAVLPNYSLAVFWHAVVDPLSGFFFLLTLLLWTRFLESKHALDYTITFCVFVLALLSKEIGIFLPFFLYLIQWWFYHEKPNWRVDVPRYILFFIVFIPYLYQVYQVQSHGEFVSQFRFSIGPHMLGNLIPYLAVLAFPFVDSLPTDPAMFIWLAIVVLIYVGVMIYKRSTMLLFLALFAVLCVSPLLGFPLDFFAPRYLYLSTISSAVVIALVAEWLWQKIGAPRVLAIGVAVMVGVIVVVGSARVADAAANLAEYTRQLRVPFRDITRAHPDFPTGSYVYFVQSPKTPIWDFQGLFFSRYGASVTVEGTDGGYPPRLREFAPASVYYFDANGAPVELPVDSTDPTYIMPPLPSHFSTPIYLERYELPTSTLHRGKALVVILDWRVSASVDREYTVFAHLVDANGNIVSQYDALPAGGIDKTNDWRPTRQYVDSIVLPIDANAPLGDGYRLELGMYDPASSERLRVLDANGQNIDDKFVMGPFRIVP